MVCKGCGSELNDDARFCSACGTQASMGDAPVEKTRVLRVQTLQLIDKLKAHFDPMAETYERLIELNAQYEKLKKPGTGKDTILGGIIMGVLAFFGGALLIGLGIFPTLVFIAGILFICLCIIGVISGVMDESKGNPQIEQYEISKRSMEEEIPALDALLHENYDSYPQCPISFEYSMPPILNELRERVISGRADTIKEAIQCMLDDTHRAEMLELQKQTAQSAKKAAESAKDAANSANLSTLLIASNNLRRHRR
ncbi:MAG: zinc ribbon domain-containing protein [Candidatus Pelethousia sp.]|nr:zinc ribbon domain-containing protein [Candidatus Pelethousia sp.]